MTDAGDLAPDHVIVNILQVLLEFFQGFPLGHVIRELLDVPEPHVAILPVHILRRIHNVMLPTCGAHFKHSVS